MKYSVKTANKFFSLQKKELAPHTHLVSPILDIRHYVHIIRINSCTVDNSVNITFKAYNFNLDHNQMVNVMVLIHNWLMHPFCNWLLVSGLLTYLTCRGMGLRSERM